MRPIGVFDSGVGGLTVVAALRQRLPAESIVYLGDTARLPYGTKSEATVTRYTEKNLKFLKSRDAKAVVIACNTASALALPHLDTELPTWGVVGPGSEWAAGMTKNGRVGVIATASTVRSNAYREALRSLRPELEVHSQACPLFVPLVEEGWFEGEVVEAVALSYLEPLLQVGVDTVVLGCTHYPLLKPVLQRIFGQGVQLADSAQIVAEKVAQELEAADLLESASAGQITTCFTDEGESFTRLARQILGEPLLEPELVDV